MKAILYNSPYLDYNNKRFHFQLQRASDMSNLLQLSSPFRLELNEEFNFKPITDITAIMVVNQDTNTGYSTISKVNYIEIFPDYTIIRPHPLSKDYITESRFYYVTDTEILNGTTVKYSLRLDVYATFGYELYQNNPIVEVQRAHTQRYYSYRSDRPYVLDTSGDISYIRSKEEAECSRYILGDTVDVLTPKYWYRGYNLLTPILKDAVDTSYVGWLVVEMEGSGDSRTREIAQLDNLPYVSSGSTSKFYNNFELPYDIVVAPIMTTKDDGLYKSNLPGKTTPEDNDSLLVEVEDRQSTGVIETRVFDGGDLYGKINQGLSNKQIFNCYISYAPLCMYQSAHLTNNNEGMIIDERYTDNAVIFRITRPDDEDTQVKSFEYYETIPSDPNLGAVKMLSLGVFNCSANISIPFSDLSNIDLKFQIEKSSVTHSTSRVIDPKTYSMPCYSLRQIFNEEVIEYSLIDIINPQYTNTPYLSMYYYESFGGGTIERYLSFKPFGYNVFSVFENYLYNSKGSKNSMVTTLPTVDDTYKSYLRQQQASSQSNAIFSTLSKGLMLAPIAMSGPMGAAGAAASFAGSAIGQIGSLVTEQQKARDADDKLNNASTNIFYGLKQGRNAHPRISLARASDKDIHAVDDIYYYYGYTINNSVEFQSLFTRCSFNFILSNDLILGESISELTTNQRREINEMFAKGVTLLTEHTLTNYSSIAEFYGKVANYENILL